MIDPDIDSTDTTHRCLDERIVLDSEADTESNEFGDTWCAECGERILPKWNVTGCRVCDALEATCPEHLYQIAQEEGRA